nr:hypothetical protein GCM10025699_77420 [Microbacterium flavescens]
MTDDDTLFDWQADPATAPLMAELEDAESRGDVAAQIDALTRLWLDGPTAEEARVGDPARALFADMNRVILDSGAVGDPGDAGLDTWRTLDGIGVPVLASWGELDIPADLPFYEETARRLGQGPDACCRGWPTCLVSSDPKSSPGSSSRSWGERSAGLAAGVPTIGRRVSDILMRRPQRW